MNEEEVTGEHESEDAVFAQIETLLRVLTQNKPNDRSELDRVYAVAITDAQRLFAWWQFAFLGLPDYTTSVGEEAQP